MDRADVSTDLDHSNDEIVLLENSQRSLQVDQRFGVLTDIGRDNPKRLVGATHFQWVADNRAFGNRLKTRVSSCWLWQWLSTFGIRRVCGSFRGRFSGLDRAVRG